MSKNFEEEYKALANEELPDLWNRIESGLTPKTTALAEENGDKQQTEGQEKGRSEKRKVISFLYRYRTVAVAALCVIVILPAVLVLGKSGSLGGSESWESTNDSAQMAMDKTAAGGWDEAAAEEGIVEDVEDAEAEATTEEASEAYTPTQAQESLQEDEALASGGASDAFSRADNGMDTDGAALPADMATTEAEKKMKDEASDLSDAKQEAAEEESREESVKVYEKVTVKVTGTGDRLVETDSGLFSEVKMKVIKDPSGELSEGLEITVGIAVTSSRGYFTGEEYTLDISYSPDRECPYRTD